ncbi:phage integrase family protein [Nonomuraea sp. PA05]|uniref:tyrosine-type recombinase/integrase n=1 Tax=Nonomuraea sp. PA05 TaxID=2604466 RepID=UPI0011D8DF50|nr:tyrosine-type recombinase/integrase [Nonomuraea sp. PA05]TYB51316.1 phage integrase family protein [Nonomuraea sp. PA05]
MLSSTPSSASLLAGQDHAEITSRKVIGLPERLDPADDSLPVWTERYLDLAVRGVRSAEVTAKISRHLERFGAWITGRAAAVGRFDGRLSARSINAIVGEIGRLHDAQMPDPDRKLGTLRPHDARHTFAYGLSQASGRNRAELERRLGHANDRYLRLYTNPPDDIAADYVEDL